MHDPLIADVDKDVSDEEAQQSSFDYVSISTADLSDDEIKQKKEDAQKTEWFLSHFCSSFFLTASPSNGCSREMPL